MRRNNETETEIEQFGDEEFPIPESSRRNDGYLILGEMNDLSHLMDKADHPDEYCCVPAEDRFPD